MEQTDIKKLFAVLQARYGHKWTSAYDDPMVVSIAVQEWHRGLQEAKPDDIRRGLDRWQDAWPPSLPEFMQACRQTPEERFSEYERKCAISDERVRLFQEQRKIERHEKH